MGDDQGNINNYPLLVQGSRNGVAVKLQGATPNRNENFITFWDGNGNAMSQYSSATDALKGIKQYATNQGMNLNDYPYLSDLLDNPTRQVAQKALDYYQKVLANLENIVSEAEKQRNPLNK